MNARELATVLAALRVFQQQKPEFRNAMSHFESVKPLDDGEIDELCEKLNTSNKNEMHIVWNIEDIKGQAESDGVDLTDDEAREILAYLSTQARRLYRHQLGRHLRDYR